jgi:hypothetical protein
MQSADTIDVPVMLFSQNGHFGAVVDDVIYL